MALAVLGSNMSSTSHAAAASKNVDIAGLAATLVLPDKPSGHAVVIIAGSGPTDRDGNNAGGLKTDAYKAVAEGLASAGIASVRYDKRGIGASVFPALREEDLNLATFVSDAGQVAAWLARQDGVTSISLIGHSEGGIIALRAAAAVMPRSVVLLCVPGRRMGDVVRDQFERGGAATDIKRKVDEILTALEAGREVADVPPALAPLFRPSVQPFIRSIAAIDPTRDVAAVAARVMIVGGGRDVQVTRGDFDALAAARPDADKLWDESMSHTLKVASRDPASQQKAYTDPTLPLVDGLAAAIAAFILRR
jgi:pimeloyl-ACP methyl ester carboxylesterase